MFAETIKIALGGEDSDQATSRAIATIRAGITHPAYLASSGIDVEVYSKAMVVLLQSVMYKWTSLATMHPYDKRITANIHRARQDLRWIQSKYPAGYKQMAEFMRQKDQMGGGPSQQPPSDPNDHENMEQQQQQQQQQERDRNQPREDKRAGLPDPYLANAILLDSPEENDNDGGDDDIDPDHGGDRDRSGDRDRGGDPDRGGDSGDGSGFDDGGGRRMSDGWGPESSTNPSPPQRQRQRDQGRRGHKSGALPPRSGRSTTPQHGRRMMGEGPGGPSGDRHGGDRRGGDRRGDRRGERGGELRGRDRSDRGRRPPPSPREEEREEEDEETLREEYEKYIEKEEQQRGTGRGRSNASPPPQRDYDEDEASFDEEFDYEAMREELKDFESFGDDEDEEEDY